MIKYKFVEWTKLALADVVLCMRRGGHYRLVRHVNEIEPVQTRDGSTWDMPDEYWVGRPVAPIVAPLKIVHDTCKRIPAVGGEYRFNRWSLHRYSAHLHIVAGGYKWSDAPLRAGDVITDGDRVLKIIRRVEKFTRFIEDYGITERELPHDQSYFEYVDDNGLAGEIHDGGMYPFTGPCFNKYPVVI